MRPDRKWYIRFLKRALLISNLEPRQLLGKIRQPYSSEMARDLIF
ncbi:hypothetical protein ES703_77713 [subsurface metagenome]